MACLLYQYRVKSRAERSFLALPPKADREKDEEDSVPSLGWWYLVSPLDSLEPSLTRLRLAARSENVVELNAAGLAFSFRQTLLPPRPAVRDPEKRDHLFGGPADDKNTLRWRGRLPANLRDAHLAPASR